MTDTTTLIQRLRDEAFLVLSPKAQGTIDVVDIDVAISALEQQAAQIAEKNAEITRLRDIARDAADAATKHQSIVLTQAAQIEALQLTKAGLIGSLREEMDEGLRLRELGGALPDENITAMTERLIGERAALAAELSALRADAERLRALATCGCGDGFTAHDPGTCGNCMAAIDAALRQEGPKP